MSGIDILRCEWKHRKNRNDGASSYDCGKGYRLGVTQYLAAYGCYLTTSTYSSANHTAHKLAEQIKKSGMPFPASRYEFRENHLEVYSLPKNTRESTLAYNEFEKLGEDRDYFYLFRDSYGGYMVPKKGIDASARSRSNSDESQNLKAIGAFREFLENKSGKRIYRKTIPLVRVMQALKKKR